MKLKKLFNGGRSSETGTEISGSYGEDSDSENLLGGSGNNWQSWSFKEEKKGSDDKRGRLRRSSSARAAPKRSKSEVGKRLDAIEADFGGKKMRKKSTSRSVGGSCRGPRSTDTRAKIDSLALERSGSDANLNQSGLESMFQSKSERFSTSKPAKKLRGGKRNSYQSDDKEDKKDKKDKSERSERSERSAPRRSRSTSTRGRRSGSEKVRSSSKHGEDPKPDPKPRSSSKRRSSSKLRRASSKSDFPESIDATSETRVSVSTMNTNDTKDSKESKKKKKKTEKVKRRKSKDGGYDSKDDSSLPSKVELNDNESQESSINDSAHARKKKTKEKEKAKKSKHRQSKSNYAAEDFGDGLEGLAEEFKRSKDKSNGAPDSQGKSVFDQAWSKTDQAKTQIERSKSFSEEKLEADLLRQSVELEAKQTKNNEQQEEILKLQQQLSTALQKQLTMSEEHIREKNEFMNVSRDLERVRVELAEARQERREVLEEMKERDRMIEEDMNKIDGLEQEIDKQVVKEEELAKKVKSSEAEIEHLLDEIQKFEKKAQDGETGGGGASFVELRNAKKELAESEEENASMKLRIEQLEKELKDSLTVPQLQIEELDQENKALQGRLKGERLEYTSKLSAKDDAIQSLRAELSSFTSSPDAQDLQSALQKLSDAQKDATTVREDLAAHVKTIEQLHGEREDFMAEFNLLKDNNAFMEKTVKELNEKSEGLAKKVTVWTEKTYDWKKRAETAEKKLSELDSKEGAGGDLGDADPQGMFLQAAMEKGKTGGGGWGGIFRKGAAENQDQSADEIRVRVLEDQNLEFEAKIAQLNSDLVKMQTAHKEELYTTKKKIAQLEGENEALTLQNSTLEQLAKER